MYNTDQSIREFAHTCFQYGLEHNMPVYLATKQALLREYDARFKDLFEEVFDEYFEDYQNKFLTFEHRNVDDMAAQMLKSKGGFLLACKNYDGDILSSVVAQGFGQSGLVHTKLVNNQGVVLLEAGHGTITRHYKQYCHGDQGTSSNPSATIYAWCEALRQRARKDGNKRLYNFSQSIVQCLHDTVNDGILTKDLAARKFYKEPEQLLNEQGYVTTDKFIEELGIRIQEKTSTL